MHSHSASERSVGYLFLIRARVANHYPTHPFRTVSYTEFSEVRLSLVLGTSPRVLGDRALSRSGRVLRQTLRTATLPPSEPQQRAKGIGVEHEAHGHVVRFGRNGRSGGGRGGCLRGDSYLPGERAMPGNRW